MHWLNNSVMRKYVLLLLVVCSCALSKDQKSPLYRGDKLEYYKGILEYFGYSYISADFNFTRTGKSFLISANVDDDYTIHVLRMGNGLVDDVIVVDSWRLKNKVREIIDNVKTDSVVDIIDSTNWLSPILDVFEIYNVKSSSRGKYVFTHMDYDNEVYKTLLQEISMILLQAEVNSTEKVDVNKLEGEFPIEIEKLKAYLNYKDFIY